MSDSEALEVNLERKGGGSKQSKSETITVRLDPKLRFAIELASRGDRRTASNIIEVALMQYLSPLSVSPWLKPDKSVKLSELVTKVWDIDDADRLLKLKRDAPDFLTPAEEKCLKLFAFVKQDADGMEFLRRNFQTYMDIASGRLGMDALQNLK